MGNCPLFSSKNNNDEKAKKRLSVLTLTYELWYYYIWSVSPKRKRLFAPAAFL